MSEPDTDILVIGAGPTGLAAACRLARAGRKVVVVDAAPEPGGLCRTIAWGELRYDIGGHRFHTAYPDVEALVLGVAADERIDVVRKSRIHLGGRRFLHFPPAVGDTLANVPWIGIAAGLHSLWGALVGVDPEPPADLRAYLRRQFGDALYGLVFAGYTEKVWGLPPEAISPDWGAARVGGLSLTGLLRQALGVARGGARSVETFRYPADGYGRIFARMAAEIEAHGGEVRCGFRVTGVDSSGPLPVVSGSTDDGPVGLRPRRVLSTMPLAPFVELLTPSPSPAALVACRALQYRALVLVVLDLDGDAPISDDTWLYFPHASTPFCRLHEPTNWSASLAPKGRSHVVVEYFCAVDDPTWVLDDAALAEQVAAGLTDAGLLDPQRLRAHRIHRFARAYPIYDQGYADTLATVEAELDRLPGLLRAGRSGAFLYLSSDECMRHGLVAAERLLEHDPAVQQPDLAAETVLVTTQGLTVAPAAVERLARGLTRRAADLASGTLAATDLRSALVRTDQLRAPEALPWPGLCLVRRSAWDAAGGALVDPSSSVALDVLQRIAAEPARVCIRDPRATAVAAPEWWPAAGSAAARGVEKPGLRRRVTGVAAWSTAVSLVGLLAALGLGVSTTVVLGLLLASASIWLLAGLPAWTTALRRGQLDVGTILRRDLGFG